MSEPSSALPPEILDLIVDHLHYEYITLRACSAVSKSWVPRARRHLFFRADFYSKFYMELWMKAFPDPASSPAYYTRVLELCSPGVVTAASTYARAWVQSFCHIVELRITITWRGDPPLIPFHEFSSAIKHDFSIPPQEILNLICSFPLLENLSLRPRFNTGDTATDGWETPSNSPRLTGSLQLTNGIRSAAGILMRLPNGLRFSKMTMMCEVEDADLIGDLVLKCSDSVESLCVGYPSMTPPPFDLSEAKKLKELEFQFTLGTPSVEWIATTTRTAKSKDLRQIRIRSNLASIDSIEGTARREWQDLDHLLVELWTSHSIRPNVRFKTCWREGDPRDVAPSLLPELASRVVGAVRFWREVS